MGTSVEFEEVKFWYQGSVKTGNGEAPEYPYFNGKEERVIEIMDWAKKFLKLAELKEDAEIVIRDFPGKLRKLSIERMRNLTCVIL